HQPPPHAASRLWGKETPKVPRPPAGGLMEVPMRTFPRIVPAVLTAVTLSLLAAMPLVAGRRTPAEPSAASVSINPLELMQQAGDLPGQVIQDLMTVY